MLECQQLTKRFGERLALDALDLRVGVGEIFCLLGANGAGKTTTINLMLGFHAPISGTVRVCGVDPAADPHVACALLAYIPEQVNFYPLLTGLEKLEYFVQISNAVLRRNSMSGSKVSVALVRLAFCADYCGPHPWLDNRRRCPPQ